MDEEKLLDFSEKEVRCILMAIGFIFDEGYTGDGLAEIKKKIENWLDESNDKRED